MIVEVVLELSIDKTLDYLVPVDFESKIKKGMAVEVPVRGHLRRGYIFAIKETSLFPKLAPIAKLLSEDELISEELFELALWMAKYYYTPLSSVIKSLLPGSIRKQIEPKLQLFVQRVKSREELRDVCEAYRKTFPAQAEVLDVMLQVTKGIFLSELIQLTKGSRSPVDSLAKKGLLSLEQVKPSMSLLEGEEYFKTKPKILCEEQAIALEKINQSLEKGAFETHLLFGVTGSGKTEVYLQAIQRALELGKSTIMLVPEIALTAQTVERFKSRFQGSIAILHHRLSDGERFEEWHNIKQGRAKIIVGARSAIFCPASNLGLIIVDEEHENSYKQSDDSPCYHARDVAVMRAHLQKAVIVLGSATPSLESFLNVEQKKYTLSTLFTRPTAQKLPTVKIVDMKRECDKAGGFTLFSEDLLNGIKQRTELGEQSILFLNRRGYHTQHLCKTCSHVTACPHCDLNLTYHLKDNNLACHLCGYSIPPPKKCIKCGSSEALHYKGVGTEQVERALHAIFPNIRTLRVDADTTRHKGSHDKLIREFKTGKADVLVGTQMISKGLHFPQVTLVGVLNSDSSLNIPDFRSSENAFQMITQVAGRAGRGVVPGEVIIQSYLIDNPTLQLAANQDFLSFYKEEIGVRRLFGYPPFTHMIKFTFTGTHQKKTFDLARSFYTKLQGHIEEPFFLNQVTEAGYAKVKDKFRFQMILRGPSVYQMNKKIDGVLPAFHFPQDVRIKIDVDPLSTF